MRLQAGTLVTPSEKLWSKVVKGSVPSPSRDQRQGTGTETVHRRLQEAPVQFHAAQNLGISACKNYHFHPQANLADLFLIRKI